MFDTLDEDRHGEIFQDGGWILQYQVEHPRLARDFEIPTEPLRVPVPPKAFDRLNKICSSMVPPSAVYLDDVPESERRAKRLRTGCKSFQISSSLYFTDNSLFLAFSQVPNEGIGRVTRHVNQKQTRDALYAARQERHRQASPESQVRPLPRLFKIKEIEGLRHDVPPVLIFLSPVFFSQLALAATVNCRAAA